ncbi:MAG: hypothetical protein RLN75_08990 [Longimicrobiales bacterium]
MGMGQVLIDVVTNDPERETNLRISPDGSMLLFNMVPGDTRRSFLNRFAANTRNNRGGQRAYQDNSIVMMRLGQPGRNIVSQQGARDAAWYPTGDRFAFSMLQGPQAMLASGSLASESGAVRFLTPTPCVAFDWQPSISYDGATLLFSTFMLDEPQTLATMEAGETTAKCKLLFPGKSAQWSPTARQFVFTRVVNGFDQVFTFDEATAQLTQITFGAHNNNEPAWSPDGQRVVFVSDRAESGDVFVIGLDGRNLIQITQGPTEDVSPTWSMDGHIYFVSNAGLQWDIWRAAIGGE